MKLTDSQKWLILTVLVLSGVLFYLLGPVLTPFLLGALFAYLGDPLADRLERKGLSRTLSVVIVFSVMTLIVAVLLLVLVPILNRQLIGLIKAVPQYLQWIGENILPWLETNLGLERELFDLESLVAWVQGHWSQAGGAAVDVLGIVSRSGTALIGWVANLVLIPVVTFYMLRDWDRFIAAIDHLLPREIEPDVAHIARESDEVLGAFLRGQLLVMIALGTIYAVGLWLVGVKFALLIGMIAGLLSFVPYLGTAVGVLIAGIAVMLQTHDPTQLLWVGLVFVVGQMLEGMVLTPYLVGDRIGLHPVTVIFAVMAGGQLFGFFGVLVALPVSAVIAVVIRDLQRRYLESHLYNAGRSTVAVHEDESPPS
jgi:predicted PurR-regulated permease PerM